MNGCNTTRGKVFLWFNHPLYGSFIFGVYHINLCLDASRSLIGCLWPLPYFPLQRLAALTSPPRSVLQCPEKGNTVCWSSATTVRGRGIWSAVATPGWERSAGATVRGGGGHTSWDGYVLNIIMFYHVNAKMQHLPLLHTLKVPMNQLFCSLSLPFFPLSVFFAHILNPFPFGFWENILTFLVNVSPSLLLLFLYFQNVVPSLFHLRTSQLHCIAIVTMWQKGGGGYEVLENATSLVVRLTVVTQSVVQAVLYLFPYQVLPTSEVLG